MPTTKGTEEERKIALYTSMLRIRLFEERIVELYPAQEMKCPVHLCIGQEAIASGVAANLKRDDYLFSNHRGHGHYLAKGGAMRPLMAEFYGREVDERISTLTSMIQPTLTLAVGLMVGFIALSIIMPMYDLMGAIREP